MRTDFTNSILPVWPYPFWIAHRGAGKLAPENTLAAFALGAQHGHRMFECDVKLSRDGQLFLLHDDDLNRTTNASGDAGAQDWASLAQVDAGAWHSAPFAGERLPTLQAVANWCIARALCLNIEIKPSPGADAATGQAIAQAAEHLFKDNAVKPLLSSFSVAALHAAQQTAPGLPRALLVDDMNQTPNWIAQAKKLACCAGVLNYALWTPAEIGAAHAAGLRCLAYTVNDIESAARLQSWGIDGIITDAIDVFHPPKPI